MIADDSAEFESIDPADAGWDAAAVTEFVDWAAEVGTHQLLLLDRGRIIAERYWHGATVDRPAEVYSAQKSVIGLAIGILLADGVLDIDGPVSTWLGDGWTATAPENERRITLWHLLSMTSGLNDRFEFDAEPGTVWYYNNMAYHQLRPIIEAATGKPASDALDELVHGPLAMTNTEWRPREKVIDPAGRHLHGMYSTVRDLARFGRFVLADDRGAVEDFLQDSVRPATEHNPSYGLLWWLLDGDRAIVPDSMNAADPVKAFGSRSVSHRLAPSAPPGTLAAMGAADQRLYLVPERQIAVVRLGAPVGARTAAAGNVDEEIWSRLASAMPAVAS